MECHQYSKSVFPVFTVLITSWQHRGREKAAGWSWRPLRCPKLKAVPGLREEKSDTPKSPGIYIFLVTWMCLMCILPKTLVPWSIKDTTCESFGPLLLTTATTKDKTIFISKVRITFQKSHNQLEDHIHQQHKFFCLIKISLNIAKKESEYKIEMRWDLDVENLKAPFLVGHWEANLSIVKCIGPSVKYLFNATYISHRPSEGSSWSPWNCVLLGYLQTGC